MPKRSERLNAIANRKDQDELLEASDSFYEFDNEDPFDTVGIYNNGIDEGIAMAARMGPGDAIFEVTVDNSGDGGAYYYFLGTEESVAARLEVLPDDPGDDSGNQD